MSNLLKFILTTVGVALGLCLAFYEFPKESQETLSKAQKEAIELEKQAISLEEALFGRYLKKTPSASPVPEKAQAAPSPSVEPEFTSKAAITAKQNGEIFHEMFTVIFMREQKDRGEFGNWVDTLNQGASLEGVYNGLIYSSQYKDLETNEKAASATALKVFGEELSVLEAELPVHTRFVRYPGQPIPVAEGSSSTPPPGEPKEKFENQGKPEDYSKYFVGCSVYTLKRALGEEALKVFNSKNQFKEKVALWYSKWVVHMAQRNIDFGIGLRNKPDEALHYKWAVENPEDRVKWEVLNRLHRLMNQMNQSQ